MGTRASSDAIHAALQTTLGDEVADTVESIADFLSTGPRQHYRLTRIDQPDVVLVVAPPPQSRLMRRELDMTSSEADILSWLCEQSMTSPDHVDSVLRFAPTLKNYTPFGSTELASPFNVLENVNGVPLASLKKPPSATQKREIDHQVGKMLGQLANKRLSTGRFGMVGDVNRSEDGVFPGGASTWSAAFQVMLEDILEDGEDASVVLPYQPIRDSFEGCCHLLDEITVPCLILLNGASKWNILVEAAEHGQIQDPPRVLGLLDWSSACFGDPWMTSVFSEGASSELREAFTAGLDDTEEHGGVRKRSKEHVLYPSDIRLLLYQMYHATAAIVREYYHPRHRAERQELASRRRLQDSLDQLMAACAPLEQTSRRSKR
jgi:hypothetical protein